MTSVICPQCRTSIENLEHNNGICRQCDTDIYGLADISGKWADIIQRLNHQEEAAARDTQIGQLPLAVADDRDLRDHVNAIDDQIADLQRRINLHKTWLERLERLLKLYIDGGIGAY